MNRFERDELGSLFCAAVHAARQESAVLYAPVLDMGEWTRAADLASSTRREFWECLLRMEIQEVASSSNRIIKLPPSQSGAV